MGNVRVTLFGAPRIERDGAVVHLDTRKALALCAYLARAERPESRDRLAALFWPEDDEPHARASLRRTLSTLSSALRDPALDAARDALALRRGHGLAIDVWEFEDAIDSVESHGHPHGELCETCLTRLTRAVELSAADFLAGFALRGAEAFEDWQRTEQERLRSQLERALDRLVAAERARGALERALEHARRRLALDPLHEPAHRQLMQLYAGSGDRGAALRQYRDCVHLLDHELGVAPLTETTALYERVRTSETMTATPERRGRDQSGTLEALADLHTLHGDYEKAIDTYARAAERAAAEEQARIEHKLASVYHRRGDWAHAEEHYRRAVETGGADPGFVARVHADRSLAAHRRGDVTGAAALAAEALGLAERAGDHRALAEASNILGVLAADRGDHELARRYLERSLTLAEHLGDAEARVAALNNLALTSAAAGQVERALELTREALDICAARGDRHREAALHNNLADLLHRASRTDEAMRHLKRAVTIFSGIDASTREPEVWKLVAW